MGKLCYILLPLSLMAASCATLLLGQTSTLDLASVEKLKIGKTTGSELRAEFGNPTQVIALSKENEAWFYDVRENDQPTQRAGFVLRKSDNILLTATWLPSEQDSLVSQNNALTHFKNMAFQVKEVGWVAHHEYSDEAIYFDHQLAISIRVNQKSHSVIAIAFGGDTSSLAQPPLAGRE